jgi:small neutral amino acid transporter SnatA (MarC family)
VAAAAANAGRPVSMGPATREAVRDARAEGSPRWPAGLAWALWLLTMLALAAVPWLDRLLRQAGRPDLVQLTLGTAFPVVAGVSGATVGAVLASRRPRHPVGWLLLAVALSLTSPRRRRST